MQYARHRVDDGNGRLGGQRLDVVLRQRTNHGDVDHLGQHAREIADGLASPDLCVFTAQEDGVSAHLGHTGLERHAGAGTAQLQNKGGGLTHEGLVDGAGLVHGAKRRSARDQIVEFLRRKIE